MADIFQDGDTGSSNTFMAALSGLQATAQQVLDDLANTRTNTLMLFEHGLGALNGCRQRAYRAASVEVAGRFLVSDLLDVDQSLTSATVRADSQAVTLRERSNPASAVIRSTRFSASTGTTEVFSGMYRVSTQNGAVPVGTFDLEFESPLDLILAVFDMVITPGAPQIAVSASANGVQYVDALQVSQNGYRVNAWLPTGSVRYLRIVVTPSHPDTLGGNSYTFGLTSLNAFIVEYHMQSELVTKNVSLNPLSRVLRFVANGTAGILYSLSLGGGPFVGLLDGDAVAVPGATTVSQDESAYLDSAGRLWWKDETGIMTHTLPADLYTPTLTVSNQGRQIRLAPGLDPATARSIVTPYLCCWQNGLYYVPFTASAQNLKFTVAYSRGPAVVSAKLRVQLTTRDRSQTPVFKGTRLENSY